MGVKGDSQYIGFTATLVVALGFATWMSLTYPLGSDGEIPVAAALAEPLARGPASLSPGASAGSSLSLSAPKKVQLQEANCGEPGQSFETSESQLRLKLLKCSGLPGGMGRANSDAQVSVRNLTNGFTASVFVGKQFLSTDYIDLVEGENHLRIQYASSKANLSETDLKVYSRRK